MAELTELFDINVVRQDAVAHPASGFPVLVMKAVNAVGGIDEKPDIAGAQRVLAELAKLIQAEAAEMAVGAYDESWDIQTLVEAVCLVRCFMQNEAYGDEDDGGLMKAAGGLVFKAHRKFSSDERKKLAAEGNALPDGSYPIPDVDALHRAAVLARSGHGDVAAAKRLIAKRAKELGVANPLDTDKTEKDADVRTDLPDVRDAEGAVQVQPDAEVGQETSEGGVTPEDGAGDNPVAKQIEDAVAEVRKAAEERIEALAAELAKMRETPIPGGPMLAATASHQDTRAKSDALAKAAYHRHQLDVVQDRELLRYHREELAKAQAAAA